jgi:hypothetical protein
MPKPKQKTPKELAAEAAKKLEKANADLLKVRRAARAALAYRTELRAWDVMMTACLPVSPGMEAPPRGARVKLLPAAAACNRS